MVVAIMQPYLFPYIGYFQLIGAVEKFVVYDNIEYTKKGWINRNRFLQDGADAYFTVPLKSDSDFLNVNERRIAEGFWERDLPKLLARFKNSYQKAPYFSSVFPLLEDCLSNEKENLFEFIFDSIKSVSAYLNLKTEFIVSSNISIKNGLRGKDRVIASCKSLAGETYINPMGGMSLYDKEEFAAHNIQLRFLQPQNVVYQQFGENFVPNLSIIDVLMFNSREKVGEFLQQYELI